MPEIKAEGSPTETPAETQANKGDVATETKTDAKTDRPSETTLTGKSAQEQKYELKLPAGSLLDQGDLDRIVASSKARGLSSTEAQGIVDRDSETVGSYAARMNARVESERASWAEMLASDREIGGERLSATAEIARRVVDKFASPELKKSLNETGLGNHPELVRFIYKIGKSMANDTTVLGGPVAQAKREAKDVLYGSYSA